MRKILLILLLCGIGCRAYTQTLQEKLYYTCKVWGFAKYYHSEVSVCHVNWDSVLLHVLPLVRSASTNDEFNDALDTMLLAAGPMALATTPLAPITDPELIHNRDWSWTSGTILRTDVQTILDTIKNNFRPHTMCQVDFNTIGSTTYWGGYLMFPPDTVMLQASVHISFPSHDSIMLMFFKMWNMTRYFNPYNYVLTIPIDTTLYNFVLPFDNTFDANSLNLTFLKYSTALDDAHVYGISTMYDGKLPGYYPPGIMLKYVEGKYVVIRSMEGSINPGDVITSVDGMTVAQWEDSLMQYYSAGSIEIKHRTMADNLLLRRDIGVPEMLEVTDSAGASHTLTVSTINIAAPEYENFFGTYFYPADTMNSIEWSIYNCNIGYMNFGNLTDAGTNAAYEAMRGLAGIVIDIRNYPISDNAWGLSNKLFEGPLNVTRLTIPDVTYPGTYTWYDVSMGVPGNPTPYAGKIVVIVDEQTQSAAEYTTMMLRKFPDCTVIGSHTAGADGNITYLRSALDMRFGWTSLGVFYPDGSPTQRIGIVPDVAAHPTIEGIRHHRDYVLEQALSIAGCNPVATPDIPDVAPVVSLFPNPVSDMVMVDIAHASGDIDLSIADISGKTILNRHLYSQGNHTQTPIDVSSIASGLYMLRMSTGERNTVIKFAKE